MSDQTEHDSDADSVNYDETYLQMQSALIPPTFPDDLSRQLLLEPIVFPLTRRASMSQQIWSMLLYSVCMIFALVSCLFTMTNLSSRDPNSILYSLLIFVIILVLAPASSLLCAAIFGSWRGALVSLVSISSSIQLTHLLNHSFWSDMNLGSFWFLIPVLIVTFFVGLTYEVRKYASAAKSILAIAIGIPILIFMLFILPISLSSNDYDNAAWGFCCLVIFIIPAWAFFIVGIEYIIQKFLVAQRKRGRLSKRS